ncbi:tetratricopeptide repeat protein [Calothrix sp. CCY 0018]|uniref:tetratricopeptide repeat protein n=1 Tax=Calothrix sp. CCY 0018 TaxID=3103864 RepID=UPI0039C6A0D0
MYSRLKLIALMSVSLIFSLTLPVYGETQLRLLTQNPSSLAQNPTADADKLFEQGVQLYRQGQYFQALPVYQRVLEIRRQQGDKARIALALNNLGEVYIRLDENDKANQVLQSALTIRRELKDTKGEGETLNNIGYVYFAKKEYKKALELLQQALAIRRQVNDRKGEGKTLANIGIVYSYGFNEEAEALKFLEQANRVHEEVEDKYQAGFTLNNLAQTYAVLNQNPRAFVTLEKAKLVNSQIDNPVAEVKRIAVLAWLYFRQKDKERAIQFGEQALGLARKNNLRLEELRRLNWLLNVYTTTNISPSRFIEYAQNAVNIARELKQPKLEAEALNHLGQGYILSNNYDKALNVLQNSVTIAREVKDLDTESLALSKLNYIYTLQAKNDKVIEVSLRELEIIRLQKDLVAELGTLISLSTTYNALGEHEKALSAIQQSLAVLQKIDIDTLSPIEKDIFSLYDFNALDVLSFTYASLGKYNQALDAAQKALTKAQSLQKPQLEVQALLHLAFLYENGFRNLSKAIEFSQLALKIAQQIKQPELELNVLIKLSSIYQKQRNYALALETGEKTLLIAQQLKNPQLDYTVLNNLSEIYRNQGNYQKALEFAQQSYDVSEKAGITSLKAPAINSLSQSYLLLGDAVKAEETAKQAIALSQTNNNKYGETVSLAHLTQAYKYQGKYEQGIEVAKQGLAITKEMKNFQGEVTFSTGLSEMYEALGNYGKVISVAQPNLELARKIRKSDEEVRLLINLGNAYRVVGEYSKGKDLIEQGLKIAREFKSPNLELNALNSLGYYYASQNDYQKSLELTQQSLKIAQQLKSPVFLISPQFNLGDIYNNLGDYQKSRDYYQQALVTSRKLKNRRSEGVALLSIAHTHFTQGKPQKTVELSQQALTIFQEIKVPSLQAFAHRMLSIGYGDLGNDANAMKSAQSFLEFTRKVQNPVFEQNALNLLGMIHYRFGRNSEATSSYQQAISIQTPENLTVNNWGLYAGLGRVYRKLNQTNVAIGYYKQAINGIEEIRRGIEGLPPELQNSFLDTVIDFQGTKTADIYRELAELLITQGRQAEARQVLDLLKIQEIRDFASAKTDTTAKPQILLTDKEQEIKTKSESVIALSKQISECEKTDCKEKSQLNDRLTALSLQFNQDLEKIEKEISDRIATDPNTFRPDSPKAVDIVKAQKDTVTVMVYPLVMEDKLWLLLYSGDAAKKFEVKVSRNELGNTVKQFRELMEKCEKRAYCGTEDIAKIKPVSEKLYSWLIKPLESELKENKVKNLVFALDRVTRYVPMSALYDGKQYLIENYTIYNVLSADLTDTNSRLPAKIQDTKVLAMGVSEATGGFPALNNVPIEVDNIVRSSKTDKGIYPGKEYLDKSVDYKTLRDNLTGNNILHLATHGVFVPGNKEASYLLLGIGEGEKQKLAISDIKTLAGLSNIHLVVLSACQTALAGERQDGVEIASLAYSFINKGAKSVIASLWQVADSSTSTLMQNFYNNLANSKQPITKAEAMRLAQLQLLYDKNVTISDIKRAGGLIPQEIPSSGKKAEQQTFAHPYYWSPFVLIGNGL